ncbi:hypothetical protein B296_00023936 [Ensete ventricosum]|uniref:Uncharacterized protein n=1 Tax=Ensete ventricosum TaxID=4639 RepID=A0A426ZJC3_ENSVE|nr:hypothetical protein B296_00023936 [Ensete ventricosum]
MTCKQPRSHEESARRLLHGRRGCCEWDLHLDRYTIVLRKGGLGILRNLQPRVLRWNSYSVPSVDPPQRSNSIKLILGFYQLAPPRFYLFLSLSFATLSLLQLLGSFTSSGLYRRHYDKTDLLLQFLDIGLEIFDEQGKLINDPPESPGVFTFLARGLTSHGCSPRRQAQLEVVKLRDMGPKREDDDPDWYILSHPMKTTHQVTSVKPTKHLHLSSNHYLRIGCRSIPPPKRHGEV